MFSRIQAIDLVYPNLQGNVDTIEIGLTDVRCADEIRIKYDYDRDGWAIYQSTGKIEEWGIYPFDDWKEVAFINAFALFENAE